MRTRHGLLLFILIAATGVTQAADTIEVWDAGAIDLELYLGSNGHGETADRRETHSDLVIGFGVARGFSAYLGATLTADGNLAAGSNELSVGAFAMVRDGASLDLDCLLNLSSAGEAGLRIQPSIELNWDPVSAAERYGFYTRLGLDLSPRESPLKNGAYGVTGVNSNVAWLLGAHVRAGASDQLLIEFDVLRHEDPYVEGAHWEVGGLAFGWNRVLTPSLELITELYQDLPQAGEARTWGARLGFISTLPFEGRRQQR